MMEPTMTVLMKSLVMAMILMDILVMDMNIMVHTHVPIILKQVFFAGTRDQIDV